MKYRRPNYISLGVLVLFLCLSTLPARAQDAAGDRSDYEILFWDSVKDSNDIDMYRAYIKEYPEGIFVPLAKIKIDALFKHVPNAGRQLVGTPMPDKRFHLRSRPEKLLERDIRDFIKTYNFSVPNHNADGIFDNIFVDNQDGTITDEATGLIWQKSSSGHKLSKVRAKRYIENLNWEKFAGHATWRLPTLEELLSLMEGKAQAPSWYYIDAIFQDPNSWTPDRIWSADEKQPAWGNHSGRWLVNFWKGTIMQADWGSNYADREYNVDNFVKAVCSK